MIVVVVVGGGGGGTYALKMLIYIHGLLSPVPAARAGTRARPKALAAS